MLHDMQAVKIVDMPHDAENLGKDGSSENNEN